MTRHLSDRRAFRRGGIDEHGILSACVRPGHCAAVIDISAGGASIDISKRLLPGAIVDLHLETARGRVTLRGRVLRCTVSRLRSTSVAYSAAIAFEHPWPWFIENRTTEYSVHTGETRRTSGEWVDSTRDTV